MGLPLKTSRRNLPKLARMLDLLEKELANPRPAAFAHGFRLATPDGQPTFVRGPPRPSLEQWLAGGV